MQTIKLTPQQPNIAGLITSETVLVLCNTTIGEFSINVPIGKSSKSIELIIKNIGNNDLVLNFDRNSPLQNYLGNLTEYTLLSDECLRISNDKLTGLWHKIN